MNRHQECWRVSRVPGVHGKGDVHEEPGGLAAQTSDYGAGRGRRVVSAPRDLDRNLARHRLTGSGGTEGTNALAEADVALFVLLALAGCASVEAGPGQAPKAPYQQSDPRDTSGMH
jgi:hypothetical protein